MPDRRPDGPQARMTTPRVEEPGVWAVSWSGGKDSCLALDRAVRAGLDVRYLVTLYDSISGRVRFHGTRPSVLEAQAVSPPGQ